MLPSNLQNNQCSLQHLPNATPNRSPDVLAGNSSFLSPACTHILRWNCQEKCIASLILKLARLKLPLVGETQGCVVSICIQGSFSPFDYFFTHQSHVLLSLRVSSHLVIGLRCLLVPRASHYSLFCLPLALHVQHI